MKKLLLTSAGLINQEISKAFLAEILKPVSKTKTLIVAYAQNADEEYYVNESKEELQRLGIQNIVIANMHHVVDVTNLGNFDVVYVCGGNTFAILDKLRGTHLDTFIINQVNSGALYVGVSAGSIIAGPDVEIAGWGSEGDKNEIGLENTKGLHFTNVAVFPHFHEGLRDEVNEFRDKVTYKVIELTNDQAVLVKDDGVKIIGS